MKKIVLISALFSSIAFAQSSDFATVDTDANGVLSIAEASAAITEVSFVDTNSDGILSEAEAEDAIEGLVMPIEEEGDDNDTIDEDDFSMMMASVKH